jgi:hypothetical protein
VNRALGQTQLAGQIDDAEPACSAREQTQNRRRTLDGLDAAGHRVLAVADEESERAHPSMIT